MYHHVYQKCQNATFDDRFFLSSFPFSSPQHQRLCLVSCGTAACATAMDYEEGPILVTNFQVRSAAFLMHALLHALLCIIHCSACCCINTCYLCSQAFLIDYMLERLTPEVIETIGREYEDFLLCVFILCLVFSFWIHYIFL